MDTSVSAGQVRPFCSLRFCRKVGVQQLGGDACLEGTSSGFSSGSFWFRGSMTLLPTQTQCRSSVKLHCYADDTQLYLAMKAEETQQSEELQAGLKGAEPDLLKVCVHTWICAS